MKSFKEMFSEVAEPKPAEEKAFKDQHEVEVQPHPVAPESQFKGTIDKKKRIADNDEKTSKTSYDKAYGVKFESVEDLEESDSYQEKDMMVRQLHFIAYAADEIAEYLGQIEDPQEWYQGKLGSAFDMMKSLYAYSAGDRRMPDPAPEERMDFSSFMEDNDLNENIKFKSGNMTLDNGDKVKVSAQDAKLLNQMFKDLNKANQKEFTSILMTDKAGFEEIVGFAREAL